MTLQTQALMPLHLTNSPSPPIHSTQHLDIHPFLSPEMPANRIISRSQTGNLKPKEFPGFKLLHTIKHPISALQVISLPQEPQPISRQPQNQNGLMPCTLSIMLLFQIKHGLYVLDLLTVMW
jgi:hypothetical protein